jgi:hypothetical protein
MVIAITMVVAMAADLVLLPSLLHLTGLKPRRRGGKGA